MISLNEVGKQKLLKTQFNFTKPTVVIFILKNW